MQIGEQGMTLIAIIGAGFVGTEVAKHLILRGVGDIVLIDIRREKAEGEALDLSHMASMLGIDVTITGTNDYSAITNADIVVMCAGTIRKPGMTREQLLDTNLSIAMNVAREIEKYCPKAKIVVVTNPVEPLVYTFLKMLSKPREEVFGFGAALDSSRLRYAVARKLGKPVSKVEALVMGQHGQKMVMIFSHTFVEGRPVKEILPPETLDEIRKEVLEAGARILELKGWSSTHAPGPGIAALVEAMAKGNRIVQPVSIMLKGEYGLTDVVLSTPCIIGSRGIEKVIEIDLDEDEKKMLLEAAEYVKKLMKCVDEKLSKSS